MQCQNHMLSDRVSTKSFAISCRENILSFCEPPCPWFRSQSQVTVKVHPVLHQKTKYCVKSHIRELLCTRKAASFSQFFPLLSEHQESRIIEAYQFNLILLYFWKISKSCLLYCGMMENFHFQSRHNHTAACCCKCQIFPKIPCTFSLFNARKLAKKGFFQRNWFHNLSEPCKEGITGSKNWKFAPVATALYSSTGSFKRCVAVAFWIKL